MVKEFLDEEERQDQRHRGSQQVGQRTILQAEELVRDEEERRADVGHDQGRDQRHPIVRSPLYEVGRNGPQREDREGLVAPCEVTPHDIEVDRRDPIPHGKERHADEQSLPEGALLEVKHIGNDQARGTEGGIARGDRRGHHAQQRENATHATEHRVGDEVHGPRCAAVVRFELQGQLARPVEEGHRHRRPNQRNDALGDHRPIEDRATLALVAHTARHEGRLRGVEARDRTAGDRDEERRHDRHLLGVELVVLEARELGNRVVAKEQRPQQTHRHHYERHAKERIDAADDLIDRQERSDDIIDQDDPYPSRERDRGGHAGKELRRTEDKDRSDQYQEEDREDAYEVAHATPEVVPYHLREAQAVVAHEHHTRKEIVCCTHEDTAERNPKEGHRTKTSAEDRSKDGARAGDVQELNEEDAPTRQSHIIHTVVETLTRGCGLRVDGDLPFEVARIGEIGGNQQRQTAKKSDHGAQFYAKIQRNVSFFAK